MPTPQTEREVRISGRLLPVWLSLPLGILATAVSFLTIDLRYVCFDRLLARYPELTEIYPACQLPPVLLALVVAFGTCAAVFVVSFAVGMLVRQAYALRVVRAGYVTVYSLFVFYSYAVFGVTAEVESSGIKYLSGVPVDAVLIFFLRYEYLWLPACITTVALLLHILSWKRTAINIYGGESSGETAPGDRILENLRTHGRDPAFRKSALGSLWIHIFIIIIVPFLLMLRGCIDPYRPPFGGGNPVVQMVQIVQPMKEKKRKQFILNPDSAIIFKAPDLDDSKLLEEVEDESKLTYVADPNAAHGKLGDGKAATSGWQDGFLDGIMRFIRLEYACSGWDDGMDASSRADANFLDQFREMSGGMKVAKRSESHAVRLLKRYPKAQAPPFVYMTGDGSFNIPKRDVEILREFLLGGSMLFADAGSASWDASLKRLVQELFPGNPLREIADDDPIFQIPFAFANGAPPLWHHGGTRALGIKVKNRWVVFYHPGDVNDAWKSGHSGMDPALARKSFQLGVNLVYYSTMRYFEETRKHRK